MNPECAFSAACIVQPDIAGQLVFGDRRAHKSFFDMYGGLNLQSDGACDTVGNLAASVMQILYNSSQNQRELQRLFSVHAL